MLAGLMKISCLLVWWTYHWLESFAFWKSTIFCWWMMVVKNVCRRKTFNNLQLLERFDVGEYLWTSMSGFSPAYFKNTFKFLSPSTYCMLHTASPTFKTFFSKFWWPSFFFSQTYFTNIATALILTKGHTNKSVSWFMIAHFMLPIILH